MSPLPISTRTPLPCKPRVLSPCCPACRNHCILLKGLCGGVLEEAGQFCLLVCRARSRFLTGIMLYLCYCSLALSQWGSEPLKTESQTPEKSKASLWSLEKLICVLPPCSSNTAQAWVSRAGETFPRLGGGGVCWGVGLCDSTWGCGGKMQGVGVIQRSFVVGEEI